MSDKQLLIPQSLAQALVDFLAPLPLALQPGQQRAALVQQIIQLPPAPPQPPAPDAPPDPEE